jgi:hypothetical protein
MHNTIESSRTNFGSDAENQNIAWVRWSNSVERFLAAVSPSLRDRTSAAISSVNNGGVGLRNWVTAIAWRNSYLPERIPNELIEVYLVDSDALPQHECETCGVAIPVRVQRYSQDLDGRNAYFAACPICGGRTGWYLHHSKLIEQGERRQIESLRRLKPR